VPIDDTHCITQHLSHVDESEPRSFNTGSFGQDGSRPYAERQLRPGDYDAQVSQRPIARHGLEHLGATDRGVIMLRNMVRRGIAALQRGEDPDDLLCNPRGVIRTYAQDTILRVAPAPTPEAEHELLLDFGRKVTADFFLEHPPGHLAERLVPALPR